ncbi:hypothetical protein JCM10207_005915 [Rhodosporidiobolus poonsookiae]
MPSPPAIDDEGRRSHTDMDHGKLDKLVQHFYSKTVAVVSQARMTHLLPPSSDDGPGSSAALAGTATTGSTSSVGTVAGGMGPGPAAPSRRVSGTSTPARKGRTNKWFNLELPDQDLFRAELKTWRSVSALVASSSSSTSPSSSASPLPSTSASLAHRSLVPPLTLETILDVSDLTPNQVLVLQPSTPGGKRLRVDPSLASPTSPSHPSAPPSAPTVVLERWTLRLLPLPSTPSPSSSASAPSPPPPDLPDIYKHSILHFRALFALVRALPAYALHRSLARRRAGVGGAGLKIGVRMGAAERREGEVALETGIAGPGKEDEEGEAERATEEIAFPGIVTPLGILSLSLTYRKNASFAVEEIETLLSSRFIDEDFFRPTIARYANPSTTTTAAGRDDPRPGSLPISSHFVGPSATAAAGHGPSPARASPPAGAFGAAARGMTGLAPLPSYGSLSSRHHYAPAPSASAGLHGASPLSTSPVRFPPPSPAPITSSSIARASPLPAPVPVPPASAPPPTNPSSLSTSASSRFSTAAAPPGTSFPVSSTATGTAQPSTSAAVEPAFISLSRARGASFAGAAGGGAGSSIQRASPLSSSPSPSLSQGYGGASLPRRTSLTGSTTSGAGSSPIFRPGSYIAQASGSPGSGSYPYGPVSRQQPLPVPVASSASTSFGAGGTAPASPQLQFASRSPLAPAVAHAGPSLLGATAPSSVGVGARPIPTPSLSSATASAGVGVGISIGSGVGGAGGQGIGMGTPSSGSLGRAGSGPFGSQGSYTSRSYSHSYSLSYGRGSEGGAEGTPGLARRASSRLSFGSSGGAGAGGGVSSSLGRSSRLAQRAAQEERDEVRKRFVRDGPPEDREDIEAFLGLLESRPELRGVEASRAGLGASAAGAGGSVLLSKRDVDEQMRVLRSSVMGALSGGGGGGGAESPSPPSFGLALGGVGGAGGAGDRASPRPTYGSVGVGPSGLSGISSLRRQTSRLSIEEDVAGEAAAAAARERGRSPSADSAGAQSSATHTTPRQPYRQLVSPGMYSRRDSTPLSPALSATSTSSTAIPPLSNLPLTPQLTTVGVEPRFLPLPVSSTTSPLASPGVSRERDPPQPFCAAFASATPQNWPPVPYPPAATTASTTTQVVSLPPAYLSSPVARAVRQPLGPVPPLDMPTGSGSGSGFRTPATPVTPAGAASVSSFSSALEGGDVETDVEAAMSSYRGEEEAVGRLELDESPSLLAEAEARGRRWPALPIHAPHAGSPARSEGDDDPALALAAAAARANEHTTSRDTTPAGKAARASGGRGYFGAPGLYSRRPGGSSGSRGASPPEISWMG